MAGCATRDSDGSRVAAGVGPFNRRLDSPERIPSTFGIRHARVNQRRPHLIALHRQSKDRVGSLDEGKYFRRFVFQQRGWPASTPLCTNIDSAGAIPRIPTHYD